MKENFSVYILSSQRRGILYAGVTSNLPGRRSRESAYGGCNSSLVKNGCPTKNFGHDEADL
jgi:predicted GIY-YIG superfamily endonuclease